jgi:V4R domain
MTIGNGATVREDSVTVKGSPIRSLLKFLEAELSAQQRDEVMRTLSPADATRLRTILPTETLPVHILNQLTEAAARAKGESVESFAIRAGKSAAADAVRGVWRLFALVLRRPTALLNRASVMWHSLYSQGELQVKSSTDHSANIRLASFPSELAGCSRMTGWIEGLAEMTGVKNVRVRQVQCRAKGAAACEWEIQWEN